MNENYLTVIPAAGKGIRAMNLTGYGAILKPFVNATERGATVLEEIIKELSLSSLNDISLIVANKDDEKTFMNFFRPFEAHPTLKEDLIRKGREKDVVFIDKLSTLNVTFFEQIEANGFGDAISRAYPELKQNKESGKPYDGVVVVLGDDMVYSKVPCCKQVIEAHKKSGCMIVAVQQVSYEEAKKFGVILIDTEKGKLDMGDNFPAKAAYMVTGIEEKPEEPAPNVIDGESRYYAILGRYVLNEIDIEFLNGESGTPRDELDFTSLFKKNISNQNVVAVEIEGDWLTVGSSIAAQKAAIKYALGQFGKEGETGIEGKELASYTINVLKENGIINEVSPNVFELGAI